MNPSRSIFFISLMTSAQMVLLTVPAAIAQTSMLTGTVQTTVHPSYAYGSANRTYVNAPPHHTAPHIPHTYLRNTRSFFQRHPMVKSAALGGGIGAASGGVLGLATGHGFFRGAVIGAGTGAGIGVVRKSQIMARHPIARDAATGGLAGLGIAGSATHGGGLVGAGVGAALGLGWGMFKNYR